MPENVYNNVSKKMASEAALGVGRIMTR